MRPLVIAVVLLSCAGDESRRAPQSHRPASPAPVVVAARTPTAPPAASPPADPRATTRQAAHDVLAEHCGECHEAHRSTNAKALAVFDLDQPGWPARFDEHRFESALRRLATKPEPARTVFTAFRDAELAASSPRTN
jgi:predicted CXXCH cytochrome family protein